MCDEAAFFGSTSRFYRVQQGVVLKGPEKVSDSCNAKERQTQSITNNFAVERRIFEVLAKHPRIVTYLGWQDSPPGLLLAEATNGSLQRYLDENDDIPFSLRKKWCRQVVESIQYIHKKGVVHSDLRPENFLVHATTQTSLDLWLCDFGGSTCKSLGLDGGHLPDSGFFNPNAPWISEKSTDIFSIGSVLYTILTGHWPYRNRGCFETREDKDKYDNYVDTLFRQGKFPDVRGLYGGRIIHGCWMDQYKSADDVLEDLDAEVD